MRILNKENDFRHLNIYAGQVSVEHDGWRDIAVIVAVLPFAKINTFQNESNLTLSMV